MTFECARINLVKIKNALENSEGEQITSKLGLDTTHREIFLVGTSLKCQQ